MNTAVSALFLLCLSAGLVKACRQYCQDESCRNDPGPCIDGEVEICGRRVCGKGPGEKCGGVDNKEGKCGSGMHCDPIRRSGPGAEGYCSGCSAARIANGVKPICNSWNLNQSFFYRKFD